MKVMQNVNAVKVTSHGIPKIMAGASLGDMSKLPIELFPSTDVYSLLLTDNRAAVEAGRQALTYFNLCDNAFIPPWLPPDAVGGVSQHIKEDFALATDPTKKDALTLMNDISKVYNKTRFFRKTEHSFRMSDQGFRPLNL